MKISKTIEQQVVYTLCAVIGLILLYLYLNDELYLLGYELGERLGTSLSN